MKIGLTILGLVAMSWCSMAVTNENAESRMPLQELDNAVPQHPWHDANIPETAIVAQVDADPIRFREVQNQLSISIGLKPNELAAEQVARLQARALEQVVGQKIVMKYLATIGRAVSVERIDVEVARLKRRAESIGKPFDQFLLENNLDLLLLKQNIGWQLGWRDYLDDQLTEAALKRVFESHRQMLDGTKVKIAHLLIRPEAPELRESWDAAIALGFEIAEQLKQDVLEWDSAVEQYSSAASKQDAGEMGWIENDGTMPELFAETALRLEVGEISEPFKTAFGVHLLRCIDLNPGSKTWQDAGDDLRVLAAKQLFSWVIKTHRPKVAVEFTGESPYFDIDTEELMGFAN